MSQTGGAPRPNTSRARHEGPQTGPASDLSSDLSSDLGSAALAARTPFPGYPRPLARAGRPALAVAAVVAALAALVATWWLLTGS